MVGQARSDGKQSVPRHERTHASCARFRRDTLEAMDLLAQAVPFLIFATGAILLYPQRVQIAELIEEFRNNLPRGGPPTGPHPSPADDSALLRRRRK